MMANTMTYKGYIAGVRVDPEAGILYGEVVGARDVVTFQTTSVRQLRVEFKASIDDYLEFCQEKGIHPDRSYSGVFSVRASPETHRKVALAAEVQNEKSLNAWIAKILEREGSKVLEDF